MEWPGCEGEVLWFSIRLTPESAPWAYAKGDPYKVVMSLEAIASLCGIMLLGTEALQQKGSPAALRAAVSVSGMGDSRGGAQAMAKGASSKFPLCVVLMEMAVQQEARNLRMDAEWAPRYANEEADALSREVTLGFSAGLRRGTAGIEDMKFIVLDEMMALAGRFYRELQTENELALLRPRAARDRKRKRLRDREPW